DPDGGRDQTSDHGQGRRMHLPRVPHHFILGGISRGQGLGVTSPGLAAWRHATRMVTHTETHADRRGLRLLRALAGPALIVAVALLGVRLFVFRQLLNEADNRTFFLPVYCYLGKSLA